MAEDEVELYGTELATVENFKDRFLHLFRVTVSTSFVALRNDGMPSKVRLSTPQSQENIEKAKIYLQALIGTGSDIVQESRKLHKEDFEMVCRNIDHIELLTQIVVHLLTDSSEVCLQGHIRNVRIASDFINMLVQNRKILSPPKDSAYSEWLSRTAICLHTQERDSHHHKLLEDLKNTSLDCDHDDTDALLNTYKEMNSVTDKWNCNSNCVDSLGCTFKERGCSPSHSPLSDLFREKPCLASKENQDSSSSSRSLSRSCSPKCSDQELTVEEVLSDPEYASRVERAEKLGYSYDQLVMALRKLGKNADENQLLSEMIKMGSLPVTSCDTAAGADVTGTVENEVSGAESNTDGNSDVFADDYDNLRDIVIDGSNVAMSHGKDVFSCRGIKIVVDWFRQRGHKSITVFVPQWRKESSRPDAPIKDQEILTELERERCLSFTPARRVGGRRVVCYDDRYVLQLASEVNGIVVSNDNYRDLLNEKPEFKKVIEERLLMYSFAGDRFMPPEDPLGRHGPSLDNFLRKKPTQPEANPPECPYGKKCTYGNKCRFYHPERRNMPHKSVTEKLQEHAKQKMEERANKIKEALDRKQAKSDSGKKPVAKKTPLTRTRAIVPPDMTLKFSDNVSEESSEEKKQEKKVSDDYNEKLNEHRRKLERALAQTRKESDVPSGITRPSDPFTMRKMSSPSADLNSPSRSPVLFQQGISTSGFPSPSQLKVPVGSHSEELVSGHLLLAKKLSDETADSTFFRERGTSENSPQSSQMSMIKMQSPNLMDIAQRLEMQMSLQNRSSFQDSDLNQDNIDSSIHPPQQYYSGPMTFEQFIRQDPLTYTPGQREHCQSFPMSGHEAIGHNLQRQQSYMDHHMLLSHVPSAPNGRRMSQTSSKHLIAPIERQNSSSDPQIHLTGQNMDYARHTSVGYSPFFERKRLASRNSLARSTSVQQQSLGNIGSIGRQMSEVYCPQQQQHVPSYDYEMMMSSEIASSNQAAVSEGLYQNSATWNDVFGQNNLLHHPRVGQQVQSQERFLPQQALPPKQPLFSSHTQNMHSYPNMQSSSQQQTTVSQQQPLVSPSFQQSVRQQHVTSPQTTMSRMVNHESQQQQMSGNHSVSPDTPIHPSDSRYSMYYNLCGLFPEPIVRRIMNEHPQEMDPQEICAYIIGVK